MQGLAWHEYIEAAQQVLCGELDGSRYTDCMVSWQHRCQRGAGKADCLDTEGWAHEEIFFSWIRMKGSSSSAFIDLGSVTKYGEM